MSRERNTSTVDRLAISCEAIREIHASCAAWENRPIKSSKKRTIGPRWIDFTYGLAGQFALLGYLLILSQIQWRSPFWVSLHTWFVWIVGGLGLAYMATAALIEVLYGWRDIRETASAYSSTDSDETEAEVLHVATLARFDPQAIQYVASWLELRSKRIDNQMTWLKGCAAMSAASLGAILFDKSPLKELLHKALSLPFVITTQAMLFTVLLGILLGLAAVGKRAANSANRALRLKQVLSDRDVILDLVGGGGTTPDGVHAGEPQCPVSPKSELPLG